MKRINTWALLLATGLIVGAASTAVAQKGRGDETGLARVCLSGGCFANRYLTARLTARLEADGFRVLRHRLVPCGDGGVALGQAVVAAAMVARGVNGFAPGGGMG